MNELIEVRTNYDEKAFYQYNRFHVFKKNKWVVIIFSVVFVLLGLLLTLDGDEGGIIFIVTGLLFPVFMLLFVSLISKLHLKSNKMFADLKNIYFRFNDETIFNEVKSTDLTTTNEFKWSKIYRIYETGDSIYIYISNMQAFIIKKSDLINGSVENLRNLISSKASEYKFKIKLLK